MLDRESLRERAASTQQYGPTWTEVRELLDALDEALADSRFAYELGTLVVAERDCAIRILRRWHDSVLVMREKGAEAYAREADAVRSQRDTFLARMSGAALRSSTTPGEPDG